MSVSSNSCCSANNHPIKIFRRPTTKFGG
jgi:hypothetical protein